jgi:hypothetical protein
MAMYTPPLPQRLRGIRTGGIVTVIAALAGGSLYGPVGTLIGLVAGAALGALLQIQLRLGRWSLSRLEAETWRYALVLSCGLGLMALSVVWFAVALAH